MLLKARLLKIKLNQRLLVFLKQSAYLFPSSVRGAKVVPVVRMEGDIQDLIITTALLTRKNVTVGQ